MAKREDMVQARREKRRKQIFEGAVEVFAEKGYHAATMQEIADAAGLAKGTLYEYIQSKEDILLLIVEEAFSQVRADIDAALQGVGDDHVERLSRTVSVHLEFAKKFRDAAKVLQHEMRSLSPEGRKRHSDLMDAMLRDMQGILDDGIRAGQFRKIDTRIAAELMFHTNSIFFGYGDSAYQKCTLDGITRFIMDNYIHALIRKGVRGR